MKRPIIFLHPHLLKEAGASKVVLEFASGLTRLGNNVVIITTQVNPEVVRQYKNVKIITLGGFTTGNILFWITIPIFFQKLLHRLKNYPEGIIFCHSLAIYWGAFLKRKNPDLSLVYYFHDLGIPYSDSLQEIRGLPLIIRVIFKTILPIFNFINCKVVGLADHLIANSEVSARFTEEKYKRKIDLIAYPGVDVETFKVSASKENYIYTLGRLEKIKNIDLVIKSFSVYCKKYRDSDLKLKIIGNGSQRKELVDLSKSLGVKERVEFLGNKKSSEVAEISSKAKIGIFLCPNESFGLAAVEALSAGTASIGVDSGGLTEIIQDGFSGYLSALSPEKIARLIKQLISDESLLKKMSANAHKDCIKRFNWDNSVSKIDIFFKSLN